MTEPLPASTVIVARDAGSSIEVFMLRRSSRSTFVPDVYVFPGGRIDDFDRSPAAAARVAGDTGALEAADVYAAARETFEEAGLLLVTRAVGAETVREARRQMLAGTRSFHAILDDLHAHVDAGALQYFSRWITPAAEPRRYDARFFVARAPQEQIAEADAYETDDGRWLAPAEALALYAAGEFAMIFPTIKHLERLAAFENVDALLAFAREKTILTVTPDIFEGRHFFIPEAMERAW
ncbi:MAG: NUDIX hydrolase [Candidatus Velthaea sp.]